MSDPSIRRRALFSALVGAAGIVLLTRFGDRAASFGAPLAVLGAVGAVCGVAYAIGLLVAPAPFALGLRHLAAGGAAAWLAYGLAGAARRVGLLDTSDAFRVLWAPVSEEVCKALVLALVWSPADDRRDRREIVTAAVGIGVGFAIRENFVYFGNALGRSQIYLVWVLLRAIPPVLAHATFGMILGGAVAQSALHARVVGRSNRRLSVLGVAVAVIAHVVYNGTALILGRFGGARAIELIAGWSVVAIAVAFVLRGQVLRAAVADEPAVTSFVPSRERPLVRLLAPSAAVAALWLLPTAPSRYLAAVLTPLALGAALAALVARGVGRPRVLSAVLLGVAMRPLVRAPELLAIMLTRVVRLPALRLPLAVLVNAVWVGAVAVSTLLAARRRGDRAAAVAFAAALSAGLAGASLGSALAVRTGPGVARDLLLDVTHVLPLTLALGTMAGRIAYRSPRRALAATLLAAAAATALGELVRRLRPGPVAGALVGLTSAAILAALVLEVRRRHPQPAGAVAAPSPHEPSADAGAG